MSARSINVSRTLSKPSGIMRPLQREWVVRTLQIARSPVAFVGVDAGVRGRGGDDSDDAGGDWVMAVPFVRAKARASRVQAAERRSRASASA